jgi:hypothetical protein
MMMPNRITCLARPALKGDEFMPVPELRLIDPATSGTCHGFTPTPEADATLLWEWLEANLPPATLAAFKDQHARDVADSVLMGHYPN